MEDIGPVMDDILIVKLRPGQVKIDLSLRNRKSELFLLGSRFETCLSQRYWP